MRWCLAVKLCQHRWAFGRLLESTGDRPIVEESHKHDFWAAKADPGQDTLSGENNLGQLLMQLRQAYRDDPTQFESVEPLTIKQFTLLGEPIGTVRAAPSARTRGTVAKGV